MARVTLLAAALAALGAGPEPAARLVPRSEMEAAADAGSMRFVWGTLDAGLAPLLRERALAAARRLYGADSSQVLADRDLREADLAAGSLMLFGGPGQNRWTARLAGDLPVEFTAAGFRWHGTAYERPGDLLALAWPNPRARRRFVFLVAPNSAAALGRRGGYLLGGDDWRIVRDGELVRSGSFAQDGPVAWRYDPALDLDREAERASWSRGLARTGGDGLVVRAPSGLAAAAPALAAGRALLARMDAAGLGSPGAVTLTLCRTVEEKGVMFRETRPEQVTAPGDACVALVAGRPVPDLRAVAAARLARMAGSADSRFLMPAGAWLAGRLEGEPLERAVARLYFGRLLPVAADAATRPEAWRSPLVTTPARALLARAVWESAPPARRRDALLAILRREPPGTLDSLCAVAGVAPDRVADRYRALGDSLARAGRRGLVEGRVAPWRPEQAFAAGACLAHEVRLERGYASAACARTLRALREAGANAVSLTPFTYVAGEGDELHPSAEGGPDEESDEAVCEAAARARAMGLRVWLVPHLWAREWPGGLAMPAAAWARFEDRYRDVVLHDALLADRERLDGFAIGHEMPNSTSRHPAYWRALAAAVRDVYPGALTYVANWDETARVDFWDALDLVSVSFYAPLADAPTRDEARLRVGAARGLDALGAIAKRCGRAVLVAEAGYPARADAPVRPWLEGAGPPDPAAQRACTAALLSQTAGRDWLAGVLWWKWPSDGAPGDARDAGYDPIGQPAERVVRAFWAGARGRRVRPPAAAAAR